MQVYIYFNFERFCLFGLGAQLVRKQQEISDSKDNQSKADQSVVITHGLPPYNFSYLTADMDSCPLQAWTEWQSLLGKPPLLPMQPFMQPGCKSQD